MALYFSTKPVFVSESSTSERARGDGLVGLDELAAHRALKRLTIGIEKAI